MMKTGDMTAAHIYSLLYSDKALSMLGSHRLPEPCAPHMVGLPLTPHIAGGSLDPLSSLPEHHIFTHHNPSTTHGAAETTRTVLSLLCGRELKPREVRWLTKDPNPRPMVPLHRRPFIIFPGHLASERVGHEERSQGLHEEL